MNRLSLDATNTIAIVVLSMIMRAIRVFLLCKHKRCGGKHLQCALLPERCLHTVMAVKHWITARQQNTTGNFIYTDSKRKLAEDLKGAYHSGGGAELAWGSNVYSDMWFPGESVPPNTFPVPSIGQTRGSHLYVPCRSVCNQAKGSRWPPNC